MLARKARQSVALSKNGRSVHDFGNHETLLLLKPGCVLVTDPPRRE
jgi:hypothetical protein